jgi:hypothetical protein
LAEGTAVRVPRLQEILDANGQARSDVLAGIEGLSQEQLSARPFPDGWSIGEHLHHLELMERSVVRLLAKQAERAARTGVPPDSGTESLLHSLDSFEIVAAVDRIVAPPFMSPERGRSREALQDGLRASRAALLDEVDRASGFDLGLLAFPHPVLGRITMYQWILFIGLHERRHLAHIQRVRGALPG